MNLTDYRNIYFVGIGGIGMSSLANWFISAGFTVYGYDKTPSAITQDLMERGVQVVFEEDAALIPNPIKNNIEQALVVYTPAIPASHAGLIYFQEHGYALVKRSQVLGMLVQDKTGIGVSGTHGKTSVSSTLACILNEMPNGANAFLGGIAKNLNSNTLIASSSELVVVEADEYDRSFLTLHPKIAIVTSIDADHLDIYGKKEDIQDSFEQFIAQVKPNGAAIIKKGVELNKEVNKEISYYTYALDEQADFYASDISIAEGLYHFNLHTPQGEIKNLSLGVAGLYNVENAVAAAAAAVIVGASFQEISRALKMYAGVKRRFDYRIRTKNLVFIDDYAHHPEEIKACLKSVRHLYPGKKVLGIFQPHLFSRTKDFADDFAHSLGALDELILMDIYPARELPIPGVNSGIIYKKTAVENKQWLAYNEVLNAALKSKADVIVTMGAGDIDRLVPQIEQELKKLRHG